MAANKKDRTHWREWIDPEDIRGAIVAGLIAGLIVLGVDITLHETVIEPKAGSYMQIVQAPQSLPCGTPLADGSPTAVTR